MESEFQNPQWQNVTNKERKRSRRGCQNCRRKKKKCDEDKPTCSACAKTSEHCLWDAPLKFRPLTKFVGSTRAEKRAAVHKTVKRYVSVSDEPNTFPSGDGDDDIEPIDRGTSERTREVVYHPPRTADVFGLHLDYCNPDPLPMPEVPATRSHFGLSRATSHGAINLPPSPNSQHGLQSDGHSFVVDVLPESVETVGNSEISSMESVLFDNQTASNAPIMADFQPSPGTTTDDGIFLPGSRYQELHNTLRDHVFITARSAKPSRETSPTEQHTNATDETSNPVIVDAHPLVRTTQSLGLAMSSPIVGLTPHREYVLWKNWVDEISAWLDKFDAHEHFRHTLPTMAKTCPHLRYSMLALSARQLERKDKSIPSSLTLAIYQKAIHLLVPRLPDKDISIIASCVILCVLEMLSCSPKAWRRHLDGCASLIRSMHIHGNGVGLEKSLFWCFARMDVCGGLISTEKTLIPINEWLSTPSLEADCMDFRTSTVFKDHANYSCYLLARVLDFLVDSDRFSDGSPQSYRREQQFYAPKWTKLFDLLEEWSETRPPEMLALLTQGSRSSGSDHPLPFPTLLFGSGAAISGNQQYHTACLLMLQRIPRNVRKKPRSVLWHARQICGISISNEHHGCWTNSVQPLWLAGQVMSHPSEHKAIVAVYERIERETGWGATWRADDLKQHWGELNE